MSTVNNEGRTNELLSAYLSEIIENDPIDNHFPAIPVLDALMKKSRKYDPCKQYQLPINKGSSPNTMRFSGFDTFALATPDTGLTVFYPNVNFGDNIPISWEEKHESGPESVKVFDIVKHRTNNARRSVMDLVATDIFGATADPKGFTPLPVTVDSTGSTGGISQSTVSDWASIEVGSGSFASQGVDDMNSLWDQIREFKGMPDMIFTHRTPYSYYKKDLNVDVRYANPGSSGEVSRGFPEVGFMGIPVFFDRKCSSSELYMLDSNDLFLAVDKDANFTTTDFVPIPNQPGSSVAYLLFRAALICTKRRTQGKMTGITA